MSLLNEYINRRLSSIDLEQELIRLIKEYNKIRGTYLFIYVAANGKPIPGVELIQSDYYVITDLLSNKDGITNVDFYIETPGGSGETAEEIVRFLRNNFEGVSFVVSGEAKSAGTIIVLSGDEILMTETGSLGPIDAQMRIGRSVISAYDYIEWVEEKRKEADEQKALNPFDATMIAQITPGELGSVFNALKFAEDLVCEWLVKYKFKNWITTETRQLPVTEDMKSKVAQDIATKLTNHSLWRSHGRSIKIENLKEIGLTVKRVDDDLRLSDIVYRIQTVCRLLFDTTTTFKIFATAENKIFRQGVPGSAPIPVPQNRLPDVVEINQQCPNCGKTHKLYGKFAEDPQIDKDLVAKGFLPFPKDDKIICECGFTIDLSGIKNEIETQIKRKLVNN
ncbi:SDH family Clp fold serine proteinase [Desulfosporosinus youngiae]|uniref:ClpP class periplasmic serine protease n=1 Tax=Desulfosporosinus youngiae DSM 17734 TaxID=768710 RepID=H5Y2P8_9FIRM|nr:ATP-dependent Clp protease proteolytic subunit [Desulfosporosinus youngiae]EHQ88311.1 ClpP class periplasmic serine protease [Desulfosporosinus youngiae DSM 17734]